MAIRPRPALLAVASAAALALVTGCVGAPESAPGGEAAEGFPVDVTSCGFNSTVETKVESAITMNQGATEVALALGVEDQLAGTAYLDDAVPERWSEAYESVPVLSDAYPDLETILEAEPDFIYASYASAFDAEAAGPREDLQADGIASYVSPLGCQGDDKPETSWETVWSEIDDVASVFGVTERAAEIRAEQQTTLDDLAAESVGEGVTIFWFDGGTDTATAGAGEGGPQLVMDAVGAENVFADLPGGWTDVSWEQVVAAEPDVIVFADAAWSTAEEKKTYLQNDPVLSQLQAVQDEQFITVPFSASTPGVRLIDGATELADQLGELRP